MRSRCLPLADHAWDEYRARCPRRLAHASGGRRRNHVGNLIAAAERVCPGANAESVTRFTTGQVQPVADCKNSQQHNQPGNQQYQLTQQ